MAVGGNQAGLTSFVSSLSGEVMIQERVLWEESGRDMRVIRIEHYAQANMRGLLYFELSTHRQRRRRLVSANFDLYKDMCNGRI
jgi:hypothetical protein